MRRAAHVSAEGVNRADARLRSFSRRIGDAAMCPRCDGDGFTLLSTGWSGLERIIEPVKCLHCGGEGLDPDVKQGVSR